MSFGRDFVEHLRGCEDVVFEARGRPGSGASPCLGESRGGGPRRGQVRRRL